MSHKGDSTWVLFSGGFCSTENLANERKQLFHDTREIQAQENRQREEKSCVSSSHRPITRMGCHVGPLPPMLGPSLLSPFLPVPGEEREVAGQGAPGVKIINIQARSFFFPPLGLGSPLSLSPPPTRQLWECLEPVLVYRSSHLGTSLFLSFMRSSQDSKLLWEKQKGRLCGLLHCRLSLIFVERLDEKTPISLKIVCVCCITITEGCICYAV